MVRRDDGFSRRDDVWTGWHPDGMAPGRWHSEEMTRDGAAPDGMAPGWHGIRAECLV